MIKYSILYPYYKRAGHLHNTFISFLHHYPNRDDYEVIIAEDLKNSQDEKEHNDLLNVIDQFKDRIKIIHINVPVQTWNPCIAFNLAAKESSGSFFVISNPECFHKKNILAGLDEEFEKNSSSYVVCSCINKIGCNFVIDDFNKLDGTYESWYAHSKFRSALLHFCTALSKESWDFINGFDEEYVHGIAYDDNDFINRVRRARLNIVERDDLLITHIGHTPAYIDPVKRKELERVNWLVYHKKWD